MFPGPSIPIQPAGIQQTNQFYIVQQPTAGPNQAAQQVLLFIQFILPFQKNESLILLVLFNWSEFLRKFLRWANEQISSSKDFRIRQAMMNDEFERSLFYLHCLWIYFTASSSFIFVKKSPLLIKVINFGLENFTII